MSSRLRWRSARRRGPEPEEHAVERPARRGLHCAWRLDGENVGAAQPLEERPHVPEGFLWTLKQQVHRLAPRPRAEPPGADGAADSEERPFTTQSHFPSTHARPPRCDTAYTFLRRLTQTWAMA